MKKRRRNSLSTTYRLEGMHCPSCEVYLQSAVSGLPGVKSVAISRPKQTIKITAVPGRLPSPDKLNSLLSSRGYFVSSQKGTVKPVFSLAGIILSVIVFVSFGLALRFSSYFSGVFSSPSLVPPAFFIFGLIAGSSTCAALTGSLLLSLQRQQGGGSASTLFFLSGRVVAFTLLGAVLGALGSGFQFSLTLASISSIFFSVFIITLSLRLIGLPALNLPGSLFPSPIANFISRSFRPSPFNTFVVGFLTILLPCGFTLTSQTFALASASLISGSLILFFFSLGSSLPLFLLAFLGNKILNSRASRYLAPLSGLLIILFSLANIKSQLQSLDLLPASFASRSVSPSDLPPVQNGRQLIKMTASASGYQPSDFKVKAGIPVRWEITDIGTNGCTNALISRSLFPGRVTLTPFSTSVIEFSPPSPGTYGFSCWMGMVRGTVEVIP